MNGSNNAGGRAKSRSQAWPWVVVAVICMLGFVLVFRALLARTAWSAGTAETSSAPTNEIGHVAAAEAAAISGDQAALRRHAEAMQQDLLHDMKIPDPNRRIDPESARQQHKAFDRQVKQGGTAKQDQAAIDALMKNTPEM